MVYKKEFDIRSVLKECFETDPKFYEVYNCKSPYSLEECIESNLKDYTKGTSDSFTFNKVTEYGKLIGYFGAETVDGVNAMTGFFIIPKYRKRKNEFIELVKRYFNSDPFLVGVYSVNIRAVNWLNGIGKIHTVNTNNGQECFFYTIT